MYTVSSQITTFEPPALPTIQIESKVLSLVRMYVIKAGERVIHSKYIAAFITVLSALVE